MHPKVIKFLNDAGVKPDTIRDVDVVVTNSVSQLAAIGDADIIVILDDGSRVKIYDYNGRRVNTTRQRASMSADLGEIETLYDPPVVLKNQWKGVLGLN